jgi:hypothetical protein
MFSRASNNCDRANVADDSATLELFINCIDTDIRVVAANNSASVTKDEFN